jgi:pimeloyl-ACP methyl ester carboxylesterase
MNRIRSWRLAVATLLAAMVTLVGLSAAAPASATVSSHSAPKPTIVLVHGAWADGSSWSGEVSRLQRMGYPVLVAPNPLRGLSDADYLRDFLATISGPIVLVGHSYGGFVITNAATGNTNVEALVYVDAFIPDTGDSVGSLLAGSGSALGGDPATVFDFRPFPGAPAGAVDTYVKRSVFLNSVAQDLPTRKAEVLYASQEPLASNAVGEPSGPPAWKNSNISLWAVVGTEDMVIPPATQMSMASHAGIQNIVTVRASHLSLISKPQKVTDVIVNAARSIS